MMHFGEYLSEQRHHKLLRRTPAVGYSRERKFVKIQSIARTLLLGQNPQHFIQLGIDIAGVFNGLDDHFPQCGTKSLS